MKIAKKDIFNQIGEYLLAVVLGLFLGTIADLVTQSLVKSPFVETPSWYYLLGMIVCMIVYVATACLAQHIGYKQRIKSSEKI